MDPRIIVKIVLVLVVSGLTFADQECPENAVPDQIIEVVECSGTCFEVVKPILGYFRELKLAADKSSELKTHLLQVLKEVEIKDHLIDTLNATIKSKDEQINTLKALIESRKYLKQAQSGNVMLTQTIKSEINNKTYEIFNKDTLINSLNVKINEKNEEIKQNKDEKAESNKKLLSCLDNVNKKDYTLLENERKIQEKQKEIKSKDEQIQTLNALIKSNDARVRAQSDNEDLIRLKISEITERKNEILLLNQTINKKDEELTKLNLKVKHFEELQKNEQQKYSDEKDEFNKKLISCSEIINQKNHTLNEKDNEIQQNKKEIQRKDELLKEKDKEIQEKTDQAKTRDDQNSLLTSRINDISQNLTKANKRLLECDEIKSCTTAENGIHPIKLPGLSEFEAPCNGLGWTVIQRRMDGSVDFNRSWTEYRDGFGRLTGEFFLGLEKLHQITNSRQHELIIILGKVDGFIDFVKYDNFRIGSEKNSYPLESVGNYAGGAGDSLQFNVKLKFSTYDRDNDMLHDENCPYICNGGWWFHKCGPSSLNGVFYKDGTMTGDRFGIIWGSWQGGNWDVSLTFVEMMIRPKLF